MNLTFGRVSKRVHQYALGLVARLRSGYEIKTPAVSEGGFKSQLAVRAKSKVMLLVAVVAFFVAVAALFESCAPRVQVLLGAAIALMLLGMMPRPSRYRLPAAVALVFSGFIATEVFAGILIREAHLVPKGLEPLPLVKYIESQGRGPPTLLIVGSSFTQYGIDSNRLARDLSKAGEPIRVMRLGYGGMSLLERLRYLRKLVRAGFRPRWAMLEVSRGYDKRPLFQFNRNLYSRHMIQDMDFTTAELSLRWVLFYDHAPILKRLQDGYLIVAHFFLRLVLAGYFQTAIPWGQVQPDSYSYIPPRSPLLTQAGILRRLHSAANALHGPIPRTDDISPWAMMVYHRMERILRGAGVTSIGFYALPTPQPKEVFYDRAFFRRRDHIYPSADLFLEELVPVGDWLDYFHLYGSGRRLVTDWLASRILKDGLVR